MIVRETEPCTYSRLLAGKGLIWWADVTDVDGDVESIEEMEKRTLKKWSVAEKQDYGRLKGQIEALRGSGEVEQGSNGNSSAQGG